MNRRRFAVIILALAILGALDAFWIEPASLVTRHERLEIPHWRGELRVAVLSDLHAGSPHVGLDKVRRIVELTNAERPDLILLLGDFVIGGQEGSAGVIGGSFISPEESAAVLKDLHAPAGVFAVLGNHDWWLGGERVGRALTEAGIPVLHNQVRRIEMGTGRDGYAFWLGGIADLWAADPDIPRTLEQVQGADPVLLFTHNPDIFPDVPASVSLTIAGHTHGGQVRFPLFGSPIVPANRRYTTGLVVEEGRHLFVTSGVGTSMLPVRFGVTPEIVILTLARSAGGQ
jgi:predicted MPP superfamily phosphohydrolase